MRWWNNVKLLKKLILVYLLGAVLPILMVEYYLVAQSYNASFENSLQASRASLAQLRANYAGFFENCERTLLNVAEDPQVIRYINTRYDRDSDAILDFMEYIAPFIRGSNAYNRGVRLRIFSDNEDIYHSQEMSNSLAALVAEEWYEPVDSELGWTVTERLLGVRYGPMVGCYTPVVTASHPQPVSHVSAMFFDESQLYKMVAAEKNFGKMAFLLDEEGRIVTTTEREHLFEYASSLDFGGSVSITEVGEREIVSYNGEAYYCLKTNVPLGSAGLWHWKLLSFVPAGGIQASARRVLVTSLLLCAGSLLLGLALIFFTSRSLSRRVHELNRNMNTVLDSDFVKQVRVSGRDEIGDIERNFNTLARKTDDLIHRVYDTELRAAQLQAQNTDARLTALRGQINPHYLFNTLESIRMNLVVSGDRKTADIIQLFAESFRLCIEDSDESTYDLEKELHFLRRYFAIQEYRMRGRVKLVVDVPEALMGRLIPKLILQPLIENAVYHGLELKEEPGTVMLRARRQEDALCITVEDDGVGMDGETLAALRRTLSDPNPPPDGAGRLALRNVNSRLTLLYGRPGLLSIDSLPGEGTVAEVLLPDKRAAREGIRDA